jgi:hypothetical protein
MDQEITRARRTIQTQFASMISTAMLNRAWKSTPVIGETASI